MAKGVDLTSLEWRKIVFDGKNKDFGAYQLRKKSTKRHLFAIIGIAILVAIGLGAWEYFSYRKKIQEEEERLEAERMKEARAAVDQPQEEELPEDEEIVYQEPEELEEIPIEEPELASQAVTEIAIVDQPEKDKEVKSMDEIQENEAGIGNIDKEGVTDITKVENATKDIIAPPEPPKVEPKPEPKKPEPEKVFEAVEQQAQFPGGPGALNSWLSKNLNYPELAQQNGVEGKVIVQFVVEKDGSISSPVIARGVDKDLDREAIRVVRKMPKWSPGKNNGVAVRSKFTLPVVFRLQH